MLNKELFKKEEKAIFSLRELYSRYGYLPYKMSRFEEYDLYVRNKDFLVSDSVITFTDTSGRLMALKPDVTLSIIKNSKDEKGYKEKVYYNENVYRVSGGTHQFKEIMQAGLECIGDLDANDVFEVVYLAAASLSEISSDFLLDISHMGVFSSILDEISDNKLFKKELITLVSRKNSHDAEALCDRYSIDRDSKAVISELISIYGRPKAVLPKLSTLCRGEGSAKAYSELVKLCELFASTEYADNIRIDFSVVNNMKYYNGIVFKGFLNGIAEGVLSGGEYGGLLNRMGRSSGAIGFAIYLDLLNELDKESREYDVDVLLLYDEKNSAEEVFNKKLEIINGGKTVSCQKALNDNLRYREIVNICKEAGV